MPPPGLALNWLAWVGKEGQYRVRLLRNYNNEDCAYSGLEVLADGTFVTATYGH